MKKIVAIGGGTGLSTILKGLKELDVLLTAIVSVADDGGSSGLIRKDINMLPPGDLRNCILAMGNRAGFLETLFNYRFDKGFLKGHNLGNFIIAALEDIYDGMENALEVTSKIFNLKGKVLPVSYDLIHIKGILENGYEVIGESAIPLQSIITNSPIETVNLIPFRPKANKEALKTIKEADLIIIAPGSLFTSILPPLLVSGIKESIYSSNAKCIYISNIMTQPGETDNYNVLMHIEKILEHIEDNIFDYIFINEDVKKGEIISKYRERRSYPVNVDEKQLSRFNELGIKVVKDSFYLEAKGHIKHDYMRVNKWVNKILKGGI